MTRIALLAVTRGGRTLAERLAGQLATAELLPSPAGVGKTLAANWRNFDGFVCVMAAGIAVRAAAPLLADKRSDPCLVVVDEAGRYAVSLLSGHLGGGNELARQVAALTGGEAVITTASEVLGLPALDLWARDQGLVVASPPATMTRACARLVAQGTIRLYPEVPVAGLPDGVLLAGRAEEAEIIVSHRRGWPAARLHLCPRNLVVGVGCNRGVTAAELEQALSQLCRQHVLAVQAIRGLASIDLKQDEQGLVTFAGKHHWPIEFFSKDQLNRVENVTRSEAALAATGARAVAEPAACLGARSNNLLVRKQKWQNVTMAVAQADFTLSAPAPAASTT